MAERNVSNIELAAALDVDPRVVSRWRHPDYVPQRLDCAGLLNGMCKALKCTPGDLLVYSEDDDSA